jgi:FkbM family methyltransferase
VKGKWLINLLLLAGKGDLPFVEALLLGLARIRHKPISLSVYGIKFNNVDLFFWGIIIDVFINKVYNPRGLEIEPNDTVVDIGAHKGSYTAYAATKTNGKILSFEPNPENFADIQRLVKDNRFTNISVYQKGIGAKSGNAKLLLSHISSRHSINTRDKADSRTTGQAEISIDVLSLDDCLQNFSVLDFVKMDCEGAELDILFNASNNTMSKIKKMAIEIHQPANTPEIQALLKHLSRHFSTTRIKQQKNCQFGYIYVNK